MNFPGFGNTTQLCTTRIYSEQNEYDKIQDTELNKNEKMTSTVSLFPHDTRTF